MFARVAILIACLHLVTANYRTCNCEIRAGSQSSAQKLLGWSTRLYSTCLGCSFPGFHVSCSDVKSWCPNACYTTANQKLGSSASLQEMCRLDKSKFLPPGVGTTLYVHNKVMSNCGGSGTSPAILPSKLCCTFLPGDSRVC